MSCSANVISLYLSKCGIIKLSNTSADILQFFQEIVDLNHFLYQIKTYKYERSSYTHMSEVNLPINTTVKRVVCFTYYCITATWTCGTHSWRPDKIPHTILRPNKRPCQSRDSSCRVHSSKKHANAILRCGSHILGAAVASGSQPKFMYLVNTCTRMLVKCAAALVAAATTY